MDPLHRYLSAICNLLSYSNTEGFFVLNWPRKVRNIEASFNQMTFRSHPISWNFRNHCDKFLSKSNKDFLMRFELVWILIYSKSHNWRCYGRWRVSFYSLSYSVFMTFFLRKYFLYMKILYICTICNKPCLIFIIYISHSFPNKAIMKLTGWSVIVCLSVIVRLYLLQK